MRKRTGTVISEAFELEVDYDDPAWRTIDRSRYAYLMPSHMTVEDIPVTETGKKMVCFRELEFDHNPKGEEILVEAEEETCRLPDRAEAETAIRRYTNDELRAHPRIGFVGRVVRHPDGGDRVLAYVGGFAYGVGLWWHSFGCRLGGNFRYVVVCE